MVRRAAGGDFVCVQTACTHDVGTVDVSEHVRDFSHFSVKYVVHLINQDY